MVAAGLLVDGRNAPSFGHRNGDQASGPLTRLLSAAPKSLNVVVEHEPLGRFFDQRRRDQSASDLGKHIAVSNNSSRQSSASRGLFADIKAHLSVLPSPLQPPSHQ